MGKEAHCQCAVSVHYAAPKGHDRLARRPYRPEPGIESPERLAKAGGPEERRRQLSKGQIAPERLDQVRGAGLPGGLVVADSGSGVSGPSRDGRAGRGLHDIVGVTDEMVVFTEPPEWVAPAAATGAARRSATGWPRARPGPGI